MDEGVDSIKKRALIEQCHPRQHTMSRYVFCMPHDISIDWLPRLIPWKVPS